MWWYILSYDYSGTWSLGLRVYLLLEEFWLLSSDLECYCSFLSLTLNYTGYRGLLETYPKHVQICKLPVILTLDHLHLT